MRTTGSNRLDTDGREEDRGHRELAALSQISAALSGLSDLDAILRVGLDNAVDLMDGDVGGILLLDEETQTLSYRVYKGLSARYVDEMRLKIGEGIAGQVAMTARSVMIEDMMSEPQAAHPDIVITEGLRAFISVPLRAKEKVLGVINIASRTPRCFTTGDMYLLHSIGDQLGTAIEQAQLYERLRKARERYRRLARQILVAQEEERRRISRELHDETSQVLSGISLQLQALLDVVQMSGHGADVIARLKKIQSLTVQAHAEISRLIADLHPALLDTLGLIPAVRQYAESNLRPLGINVSVETKGMNGRLPQEVEAGLFRFAQGAIGNIVQHSKAKNATITIERQDNELYVKITDDGKGFDVSKITDIEPDGRGRGVFSMKERVALLGGRCSIESHPGKGTTVSARLPAGRGYSDAEDKGTGSR